MNLQRPSAPPPRRPTLRALALAACAASVGWWAHGWALAQAEPLAQQAAAPPTPVTAPQPVPAPPAPEPLIAVSSDGLATLRVEQQPLQWVLEQLAAQAGWPELAQRAASAAMPAAAVPVRAAAAPSAAPAVLASCPDVAAQLADPNLVLQHVESGSEPQSFQGLMVARAGGIAVPEHTLRRLYESGASARVQLAAFEAYLALRADRPDELRAALEAAQYAPALAVRSEAAQRLAQLQELRRLSALPPLKDP